MPSANASLKRCSTAKSSRHFLIHENLVAYFTSDDKEPDCRTDHSAVTVTFRGTERIRGGTFWKLNPSLFKDIEYVRKIKETIKKTDQNYDFFFKCT